MERAAPRDTASVYRITETEAGIELRYVNRPYTLRDAYLVATMLSSAHDGRPVVCRAYLPGIDVFVQSRWTQPDGTDILMAQWQGVEYLLNRLIESDPATDVLTLASRLAICTVSRQPNLCLPYTVMRLCWQ
jgi:hypothetical protein